MVRLFARKQRHRAKAQESAASSTITPGRTSSISMTSSTTKVTSKLLYEQVNKERSPARATDSKNVKLGSTRIKISPRLYGWLLGPAALQALTEDTMTLTDFTAAAQAVWTISAMWTGTGMPDSYRTGIRIREMPRLHPFRPLLADGFRAFPPAFTLCRPGFLPTLGGTCLPEDICAKMKRADEKSGWLARALEEGS